MREPLTDIERHEAYVALVRSPETELPRWTVRHTRAFDSIPAKDFWVQADPDDNEMIFTVTDPNIDNYGLSVWYDGRYFAHQRENNLNTICINFPITVGDE